jgi:hypothetical protein
MTPRRRILAFALALGGALLLASCSTSSPPRRVLTERERDSTLGKSVIPGAAAVTRTLEASDSAAARAQRMDRAMNGQ